MRVLLIAGAEDDVGAFATDLRSFWVRPESARSARHVLESVKAVDAVLVSFEAAGSAIERVRICRAIRARSDIPIVGMVSNPKIGERVLKLGAGIDDYLCRPYRAEALVARLDELYRRRNRALEPPEELRLGDVTIDFRKRTVTVANRTLDLTNKEYQILALLAENFDGVCTKDSLVARVWGSPWDGVDQNLYVHINSLRHKIGSAHLIKTVRGAGYRLVAPNALAS